MKSTEQKVLRFIKENNLVSAGDRILVALSGGPDSVFLLHFFNKFKKKFKIQIEAAHINHKLRGKDSDRDEYFCEAICDELDIPLHIFAADIKSVSKKEKTSLEITGRKIRYKYFDNLLATIKNSKLASAHNADDNTETVLLNLIKGAGLKGLSGIPIKRDKIIRPILCLTKREILDYLEENKFEYRIDQSNLSSEYERNFLRNDIIPLIQENLNPAFNNSVLNSSINFQKLNYLIDKLLSEFKTKLDFKKNDFLSIPVQILLQTDEFLISQLIKTSVDENFNVKIDAVDIKKILLLAKKQTGKSEELSLKLTATKERGKIVISKNNISPQKYEVEIKIGESIKIDKKIFSISPAKKESIILGKSKNIEYISAEKVKGDFIIRNWHSGDRFKPIGMAGTKKISDYLNDIKIDAVKKKNQLVLVNNKKIVWVIGQRLDDVYKITPKTKKVLKLCLS